MEITVVDMRKLPAGDPKRIGKYDTAVVYRTETGEQYFTTIPAEDFTEAALAAQIKKETEERGKLLGKKITI
jgi:hypothetical protein